MDKTSVVCRQARPLIGAGIDRKRAEFDFAETEVKKDGNGVETLTLTAGPIQTIIADVGTFEVGQHYTIDVNKTRKGKNP